MSVPEIPERRSPPERATSMPPRDLSAAVRKAQDALRRTKVHPAFYPDVIRRATSGTDPER